MCHEQIGGWSPEECMTACCDAQTRFPTIFTTFGCESFDYHNEHKRCALSQLSSSTGNLIASGQDLYSSAGPPASPPASPPPPLILIFFNGVDAQEATLTHNTYTDIKFTGGIVEPGDYVLWVMLLVHIHALQTHTNTHITTVRLFAGSQGFRRLTPRV